MNSSRTLIITRHAHRDVSDRLKDNGLSEKGRMQALHLRDHYLKSFPKQTADLISSPKKRCVETLEPLAKALRVSIKTSELLNEGMAATPLQRRIREFLSEWPASSSPLTVLCSHGDWIPDFFELSIGQSIDLKKGGWSRLDFIQNKWSLIEVVQEIAL